MRRQAAYDRTRILEEAARARARRKRTRAIELYRWVLAIEPQNAVLHAKLAPLLAEAGEHFDAWVSFRAAARACLREGLAEKALAIYQEAALYVPHEHQAWQAVAQLQHKRGRSREAVETLLEGSRRFRTRWLRPYAIYLLRRAREIDPWDFESVLELAGLLTASGQRHEARLLLDELTERAAGHRLRDVRAAQLRVDPGLRSAWQWLRAVLRPEPLLPPEPRAPALARPAAPCRSPRRGLIRASPARSAPSPSSASPPPGADTYSVVPITYPLVG
jgi:tetratricopeptide (TPR) repeat protein